MDTTYLRPTFSERKQFAEKYSYLSSFLCEFLDLDDTHRSLDEILFEWLRTEELNYYASRPKIVAEGRVFMQQMELPWSLIRTATNRYFATKEEAFAWLSDALDQIEATLRS